MSASFRLPKNRSKTRAMLLSRSGCRSAWQRSSTALATYWPTFGSCSICSLDLGKRPLLRAISLASIDSDSALRRQRPIGRRSAPSSSFVELAISCQDGNRLRKRGRNAATTSARVRCRRTSETICLYLLADFLRQGKSRLFRLNHEMTLRWNQITSSSSAAALIDAIRAGFA